MSWSLSKHEEEALLAAAGHLRYEYFVKKTCDEERLFSLWGDGWVLATDTAGNPLVPVWPHSAFAERCAVEAWKDCTPREIPVLDWLRSWTPELVTEGQSVAVFPISGDLGVLVDPQRLAVDLRAELAKY
ncbi:DUF2750 domain-containing protein [Erythrobacter sp. JK5]|uniref:DUF2750 domain-containing protein n=1 Tax=Erythrobacter sp. JK5 TaxID=2829500 RepID=UPI001BA56946|nr:DUF2750 domain-containing protein [Erythrobacter sp. JK5]